MVATVVVKCTISTVGIIGNGFVIVILLSTMRKSLADTTRWLILNLAICNFCDVAVYVPLRVYDMLTSLTKQGRGFVTEACCQAVSYVACTFSAVGFFTIATISLVRYLLICHPLKARRCLTSKNTLIGIVALWLLAAITALPLPLRFTYVAKVYLWEGEMDVCLLDVLNDETIGSDWKMYYTAIFTLYFLFPVISLTYFYTAIFLQLHENQDDLQNTNMANAVKSRKCLAKRLLYIAVLFVLLHSPMFLVYLLMTFGVKLKSNPVFAMVFIETMVTVHAALNPFIYCAQSRSLFTRRLFKFLSSGDTSVVGPDSPAIMTRRNGLTTSAQLSLLREEGNLRLKCEL